MKSFQLFLAFAFAIPSRAANAPKEAPGGCKRFEEIFTDARDMLDGLFGEDFIYTTDEANAYTMWFFDKTNPNDAISRKLGKLGQGQDHDTCHLDWMHKDAPGPEPDNFTVCHPWKKMACCTHDAGLEHKIRNRKLNLCGTLSRECEAFFAQEACTYECDPNTGYYRKYKFWTPYNASDPSHNKWKIKGMPIKASYVDAWFQACRKDTFCAKRGGFWKCAADFDVLLNKGVKDLEARLQVAEKKAKDNEGLSTGAIVGFSIGGVLVLTLLVFSCCLITKERAGKPMFGALMESAGSSRGQAVGNGQC